MREGDDVTIVAIGRMVRIAQQAAEELAAEGIECEIVDPRTISPAGRGHRSSRPWRRPAGWWSSTRPTRAAARRRHRRAASPRSASTPSRRRSEDGHRARTPRCRSARRSRTSTSRAPAAIADGGARDRRRQGRGQRHDRSGVAKLGMPKWGLSMTRGQGRSTGSSRRAPRSPSARRSPRSRPRRSRARSRRPRPACCAGGSPTAAQVVPVGGLLGRDRRRRRCPTTTLTRFVAEFEATLRARRRGRRARARSRDGRGRRPAPALPRTGRGRRGPIVLLHGFGGDLGNWLFNTDGAGRAAAGARARPARATAGRRRTSAPATSTALTDVLARRPRRRSASSGRTWRGTRMGGAVAAASPLERPTAWRAWR